VRTYLSWRSTEWDWLSWDDPATAQDDGASRHATAHEHSAYVLTLPTTWHDMRTSLHRNIKESLRRCYNSLKRDGLSYRLEVVDQPTGINAALADFFRLHSARARSTGGPRHPDVFETPQARAFLHDVCEQLSQRRACRIFRLWIEDRVVATRIGFELSGAQYLYYSGWEPAYARYSVMTTLVAEIVRDAIYRGSRAVHLSTGNDVSKTRWGPKRYRYITRVEIAPRATAHLLHFAYRAASRARTSDLARAFVPGRLLRQPRGVVAVTRG
jgi:CelD/BcsL family acetyltransferase involved in cellulose biosynthesis